MCRTRSFMNGDIAHATLLYWYMYILLCLRAALLWFMQVVSLPVFEAWCPKNEREGIAIASFPDRTPSVGQWQIDMAGPTLWMLGPNLWMLFSTPFTFIGFQRGAYHSSKPAPLNCTWRTCSFEEWVCALELLCRLGHYGPADVSPKTNTLLDLRIHVDIWWTSH